MDGVPHGSSMDTLLFGLNRHYGSTSRHSRQPLSNSLIKWLNALTLLISFPIIGMGVYFVTRTSSECMHFLLRPIIFLGCFILLLSLIGFVGASRNVTVLLWVYLFVMLLLILVLVVVAIMAFALTSKGSGERIRGQRFREYHLQDYHPWLQRQMHHNGRWDSIMMCIKEGSYCKDLRKLKTKEMYQNAPLSSIQSGCCKPPRSCGFKWLNSTAWDTSLPPPTSAGTDCHTFSNTPTTWCYMCDSCKAGALDMLKNQWQILGVVNVSVIVLLASIYFIGRCASRNSWEDDYFYRLEKSYHEEERI